MTATNDNEQLSQILHKIRRIEIQTKRMVNDIFSGEYHSVFKGRGMEFNQVREYRSDDDIRTIDWNVTARCGKLHVKEFVEERELTVMLLVDLSPSGLFGTKNQFKRDLLAELTALLAFSAIKNNDRVGLIAFTDQIEHFIQPNKGQRHVLRLIREIYGIGEPKGRGTNIKMALDYLAKVMPRRGIVFLLSDFIDQNYELALRIANKKHDLVAVRISDPREYELPNVGLIEVEDPETGAEMLLDTSKRQLRVGYKQLMLDRDLQFTRSLQAAGVDLMEITTGESYVKPIMQFFRKRACKLR